MRICLCYEYDHNFLCCITPRQTNALISCFNKMNTYRAIHQKIIIDALLLIDAASSSGLQLETFVKNQHNIQNIESS